MSDTKNNRVAIIEDDPRLAEHYIDLISPVVDLDLAGVASSVTDAQKLFKLNPDLFLVDIGLPDGSGIDLVPKIKSSTDARILVITSFGDRQTVVSAIKAGADGYLLKDSRPEDFVGGIKLTLDGGAPISDSIAIYLLEQLRQEDSGTDVSVQGESLLSKREAEILNLFAKGFSYRETAETLGLSPKSIGTYVKSIYGKLAVHSRSEAVYEAVKTGQLKI